MTRSEWLDSLCADFAAQVAARDWEGAERVAGQAVEGMYRFYFGGAESREEMLSWRTPYQAVLGDSTWHAVRNRGNVRADGLRWRSNGKGDGVQCEAINVRKGNRCASRACSTVNDHGDGWHYVCARHRDTETELQFVPRELREMTA
jgi:hypothetical protein